MTQHKEDQQLLIDTFRNQQSRGYRPNVAYYDGDASEPMRHPKGDARRFSRWGAAHALSHARHDERARVAYLPHRSYIAVPFSICKAKFQVQPCCHCSNGSLEI